MTKIKTILLTAVLAAAIPATAAFADGRHDHDDHGRREFRHDDHDRDHHDGPRFDIRLSDPRPVLVTPAPAQQIWIDPVYTTTYDDVLVPATYRTVVEHVWVPDVTQTVTDRVWVPDRYETREVIHRDHGRRIVTHQTVLVAPAHYEDQPRTVVVAPGHYEDQPRQELVTPEHYEKVPHQQLLTPGHWETVAPAPVIVTHPAPTFGFHLRF